MARMLDVALYWGTSMHNKNKAAAAAFRINRRIHMIEGVQEGCGQEGETTNGQLFYTCLAKDAVKARVDLEMQSTG